MLKALAPSSTSSDGATDAMIYNRLVKGSFKNRQVSDKVEVLLADGNKLGLYSQEQCLAYLGSRLRTVLEGVSQE